jgi:hypothetical protein
MNKLLVILFAVSMVALGGCSKDLGLSPHSGYTITEVKIISGDTASFCAGTGELQLQISGTQAQYSRASVDNFQTRPKLTEVKYEGSLRLEPCAFFPSNFQQYDSYGKPYPNIVKMDGECKLKLADTSKAVHSIGSTTMSMKGEITHAGMQPWYTGFNIDCP